MQSPTRSYVSTRGADEATLSEALFRGVARDGGLYVPREIALLPAEASLATEWSEIARRAAPALLPTVPRHLVDRVVAEALTFPVPLVEVETGVHVLELFHGPTGAFKDIGARVLARLCAELAGDRASRTVLVATSGDTGGAVASAFHGVEPFRVVVLFPLRGVSDRQRRQMTTLGGNVHALAVDGTFDDCQRMTKEAFLHDELSRRYRLMSANSINLGRLLPQVLYYVHAAAGLGWHRPACFVVPSGNLGNLCAGLIAQRMGVPASGFVAATNRNRGFVEFLERGSLDPRPAVRTISTAMDVGHPSNLERIRWLYDDRVEAVRERVVGVTVSDEATVACMRDVFERTGYLLDPHGAVAYEAGRPHHSAGRAPTVVLATAHPAKFPDLTEPLYGGELPLPPGLASAMDAEEHMREIPATLEALTSALETTP